MVNLCTPPALILASCLSLSACGAIEDIRDAVAFSDERDQFTNRREALSARSNSAFTAIPDENSETYQGEASLAAGTSASGVYLIGDAVLVVDFEADTVEGTLSSFGGFDRAESYADYSGTLVFVDGEIGVDRPNDLESEIVGTLRGGGYTIEVDAEWEGDFKGSPIRGVLGNTSVGGSTFELNGTVVPGGIVIAASS